VQTGRSQDNTITFVQFIPRVLECDNAIFLAQPHRMQNTQPPAQNRDDDEISLLELWRILMKRKGLILVCFLGCLAAGAAFAFLKAPVYEADIKLRIGQVKGNADAPPALLDVAEELSSRILAQYGEDIAQGIKREHPFISKAVVQRGGTTTLELTAEADSPADAAHLLEEVVSDIRKAHKTMYEDNLKPIAERLKSMEEQRRALQQQYGDITALVDQLKERDTVQASLVMIERGPIAAAINELDAERLRLSQQMTPPQTRPTELIGEITAPAKPSKPKKALVLALAAVLGLMGSVMLALVAEFVARAKMNGIRP